MTLKAKYVLALLMGGLLMASVPAVQADVERYAFCPFALVNCGTPVMFEVDGRPVPEALSRRQMTPIGLQVRGKISSAAGDHPPALREAVIDLDKNVEIDATRFSTCRLRQLEDRRKATVRASCRDANVGMGEATVEIAQPGGERPILISVPLTLVNGGVIDGSAKLFVHGEIPAPHPVAIVSVAKVEKARKGRYGHTAIWRIPSILDGAGSLLGFNFQLKRGYVSARCTDGKLQANMIKALFRNEIGPRTSTTLKGTMIKLCSPTLNEP